MLCIEQQYDSANKSVLVTGANGGIGQALVDEAVKEGRAASLGSRSQGGERTIERLLSVDQTCRLQRRSLYSYLSEALTAKARGDPVPSLA